MIIFVFLRNATGRASIRKCIRATIVISTQKKCFITPEIIQMFSLAGRPDEIVERLKEVEQEGLNVMNFIPTIEQQYRLIEDFACKVIAKM